MLVGDLWLRIVGWLKIRFVSFIQAIDGRFVGEQVFFSPASLPTRLLVQFGGAISGYKTTLAARESHIIYNSAEVDGGGMRLSYGSFAEIIGGNISFNSGEPTDVLNDVCLARRTSRRTRCVRDSIVLAFSVLEVQGLAVASWRVKGACRSDPCPCR